MSLNEDAPRMTLAPSPVRRVLATAFLAVPGAALIWLAAQGSAENPLAGLLTVALGVGALLGARAVWRAMRGALVLTTAGLTDADGAMVCPIEQIARVDSGLLSFRPSGGFLLHLASPAPPGWVPGLWWRRGRRLGVGGAVHRAQAKAMAEAISAILSARAANAEDAA
jgi:hypothetical protein